MFSTLPVWRTQLARFGRDRNGGLAVIAAVVMVPTLVAGVMAVDYLRLSGTRQKLSMAADAAAIAGAKLTADRFPSGGTEVQWAEAVAQGITEARRMFTDNLADLATGTVDPPNVTITRTESGAVTVSVSFEMAMATLLKLGSGRRQLAGTATATTARGTVETVPQYSDIYILLDRSGSMTVGEAREDVVALDRPDRDGGINCAFACHDGSSSTYTMVRDGRVRRADGSPARLKFDVAKTAIREILDEWTASTLKTGTNYYRMGIYSIGGKPGGVGDTLVALTDSVPSVASRLNDLQPEMLHNMAGSKIRESLDKFLSTVGPGMAQGDGSAPDQRKSYVIVISDGVESISGNQSWTSGASATGFYQGWNMLSRSFGVPFVDACARLRTRATVATIEVLYPQLANADRKRDYSTNPPQVNEGDKWEKSLGVWLNSASSRLNGKRFDEVVANAMRECASSADLAHVAGNRQNAINDAVKAIFKKAKETQKVYRGVRLER